MNFFFILSANKLKKALIIVVAAFFTAGIFYIEKIEQSVFSTVNGPRAIYQGEEQSKNISLTFNIAWGNEKAEPILDILKREKVDNATFFVSGEWAETHPDLVKRIVKDGHEIGLMGYRYKDYTSMDAKKVRQDISLAKDALAKLNVKNINLLRPPYGSFNETVLNIADSLGFTVVHWSVDSQDDDNSKVKDIVTNVLKEVKGGDIILLHASDSAKQTEKALPLIIKGLKDRQLPNVSISELISNAETKSKEIN